LPSSSIPEGEVLAEAHDGDARVLIEYLGEGYSGCFDPRDADDVPLARISARLSGGDEESYCTVTSALAPREKLLALARAIARDLGRREHIKRRLQEWSWVAWRDNAFRSFPEDVSHEVRGILQAKTVPELIGEGAPRIYGPFTSEERCRLHRAGYALRRDGSMEDGTWLGLAVLRHRKSRA
jgi:hypothetical protein